MKSAIGRRAFHTRRSGRATDRGAYGSENVGMSNRNVSEILTHRKSEVSWAMLITPGLVGPKARLKSVVDGQRVNIPVPFIIDTEGRRRLNHPDVGYRFKRSRCRETEKTS